MNPDDHQPAVPVLFVKLLQLGSGRHAQRASHRPESDQDDLATESCDGVGSALDPFETAPLRRSRADELASLLWLPAAECGRKHSGQGERFFLESINDHKEKGGPP